MVICPEGIVVTTLGPWWTNAGIFEAYGQGEVEQASKWEKAPVPEKLPEPEKGESAEKEENADKAVQLKRRRLRRVALPVRKKR